MKGFPSAVIVVSWISVVATADVIVTDLGTLGGTESLAGGVNAHGLVIGCARDADNNRHAVAFDRLGGLRVLGDLGGEGILDCSQAVNDAGDIAGIAFSPDGLVSFRHGYDSGMEALPTMPGGFLQHLARGMNDTGLIVGWAFGGGNPQTPFVVENGVIQPLPIGTDGTAWDVNDAGTIVGACGLEAARWTNDGGWTMSLLGAPPVGPDSVAVGIGADGTILGQMGAIFPSGTGVGFTWIDGVYTPLATPAGYASGGALAINAHGVIIGGGFNGGGSTPAAARWRNGVPEVLNDLLPEGSPWTLDRAWGINDRGQIAGEGTIGGETHGYLLSPDCNGNGLPDHEDIEGVPTANPSYVPDWDGNGIIGGVTGSGVERDLAQTFTAATSGHLLAVRFALRRTGANAVADGVTLPLDIVGTTGTTPNPNDVLGSTVVLSTNVATGGTDLMTIDLQSAEINLTAGTRYAVLMRPPDVTVGEFDWLTFSPGQYFDGGLVSRNDGGTWSFQSADALFEIVMRGTPTSVDANGDGVPDECAPECPADIDDSGDVGFPDLLELLAVWGLCVPDCPEDLNGDDFVGFDDLLMLLANWGPCDG